MKKIIFYTIILLLLTISVSGIDYYLNGLGSKVGGTSQNNYRIGMVIRALNNVTLMSFNTTTESTSTLCGITYYFNNSLIEEISYTPPLCDLTDFNLTKDEYYVVYEYKAAAYKGSINTSGATTTPKNNSIIVWNMSVYSSARTTFVGSGTVGAGDWYGVWSLTTNNISAPAAETSWWCVYSGSGNWNIENKSCNITLGANAPINLFQNNIRIYNATVNITPNGTILKILMTNYTNKFILNNSTVTRFA